MTNRIVQLAGIIGSVALFAVMALVFVAVLARYFFGFIIPDAYDLSRMFLGILIFWGIALAVAQDSMIKVDALYSLAGPVGRKLILIFSSVLTAAVLGVLAWRAATAVLDAYGNFISTNDLRLRLWPFYGAATLALFIAVTIALARASAVIRGKVPSSEAAGSDQDNLE